MSRAEDSTLNKAVSDLESAKMATDTASTDEGDILEPLLFLLAARRGVHQDPSFASTHVPDDRTITFKGPSGVEPAVDRSSRWSRFVRHMGYLPTSSRIGFTLMTFYLVGSCATHFTKPSKKGSEQAKRDVLYGMKLGLCVAALVLALLIAAGRAARKQTIAAIPPEFNLASYQYRLLNAMRQRGIHYREIQVISLEKKMKYWRKDPGLRECFTIKGVVDPGSAGGAVYDVVVNFWNDGRLNLRFWPTEENGAEDGLAGKAELILEIVDRCNA